jgi:hypothetical protein
MDAGIQNKSAFGGRLKEAARVNVLVKSSKQERRGQQMRSAKKIHASRYAQKLRQCLPDRLLDTMPATLSVQRCDVDIQPRDA